MATALERHLALIGFMGAGKSTLGASVAERLDRRFVDLDREIEDATATPIPQLFERRGEDAFREVEERLASDVLVDPAPAVIALGGGAVLSPRTRGLLADRAVTVLVDVDVETAWRRAADSPRPLARDEAAFRRLYDERQPLYDEVADARACDADGIVLAAGGIRVEPGALERLGDLLPDQPLALVADSHVAGIYGPTVQGALGHRLASRHVLPQGEDAKTPGALGRLWSELRLDRDGLLVALGGGTTTDAAGFAAATYLRGIDWAAVPTTLVGQVDAAIGGKTAVDLPEGKNLVGAFHWPVRTVIDPGTLETLPDRERLAGMSEVVKTGLLAGERLWELALPELVRRCAAFKTAVCLRDPKERGDRAILNLGHTFAHALEAGSNHEVAHGEAVALGLLAALRLSGLEAELGAIEDVLRPRPVRADRERAWAALGRDKKRAGGKTRLVLLEAPGRPRTGVELPDEEVRRELDRLIAG